MLFRLTLTENHYWSFTNLLQYKMQKRPQSFRPVSQSFHPPKYVPGHELVSPVTCLWNPTNNLSKIGEKRTADKGHISNFEGRVTFQNNQENQERYCQWPLFESVSRNRQQGHRISKSGVQTERSNGSEGYSMGSSMKISTRSNSLKMSLRPFSQRVPGGNCIVGSSTEKGSYNGDHNRQQKELKSAVQKGALQSHSYEARPAWTIASQTSNSTNPMMMAKLPTKPKSRMMQQENFPVSQVCSRIQPSYSGHRYLCPLAIQRSNVTAQASQMKGCKSSEQGSGFKENVDVNMHENKFAFLRGPNVSEYKKSISIVRQPMSSVEPQVESQGPKQYMAQELAQVKRSCETNHKTLKEMNESESICMQDSFWFESDELLRGSPAFENNPRNLKDMKVRNTSSVYDGEEESLNFSMVIAGAKDLSRRSLRTSFFQLGKLRNKAPTLSGFLEPYTIPETQREIGSSKIFSNQ